MKTSSDPRHIRREEALKQLFQYTYQTTLTDNELANLVIHEQEHIDNIIVQAAPEWPLQKLNRVDLSILRLAVFELLTQTAPHKVIIDEAVELAKQYGAESSPRFINGALGAALKLVQDSQVTPETN